MTCGSDSGLHEAAAASLERLVSGVDVDVWSADLDTLDSARLLPLLSPDEQARAARFHFTRDRDRYTSCRALLRTLLGAYLVRPAVSLRFSYGREGKPALHDVDTPLHFNIAHSESRAVLAFTCAAPVGVDVEAVRHLPELDEIATHYFSVREIESLRTFPASERAAGFYRCWTRKEAFVKALGDGLARPLDEFAVALHPDTPASLAWLKDEPTEPAAWSLHHFEPAPGFVGAAALRHPATRIVLRALTPSGPRQHQPARAR